MIGRGLGLWDLIQLQWAWTRQVRETLYGTQESWKRIRSTHGPGVMAFLRSVLQWVLEWSAELLSFGSGILRSLAFYLSQTSYSASQPPDIMNR